MADSAKKNKPTKPPKVRKPWGGDPGMASEKPAPVDNNGNYDPFLALSKKKNSHSGSW